MLTICLTCTKCGNVFEATTSEPVPSEAVERLGDSFVCSRCTSGPYKTIPRRRYHCTTCAVAIWPNGYEEKTVAIGPIGAEIGGTCCVCEREKPGKDLHLVSAEHPAVTANRASEELKLYRAAFDFAVEMYANDTGRSDKVAEIAELCMAEARREPGR